MAELVSSEFSTTDLIILIRTMRKLGTKSVLFSSLSQLVNLLITFKTFHSNLSEVILLFSYTVAKLSNYFEAFCPITYLCMCSKLRLEAYIEKSFSFTAIRKKWMRL